MDIVAHTYTEPTPSPSRGEGSLIRLRIEIYSLHSVRNIF